MARAESHKGAGHRQRLREKFLKSGLDGFHDYEVLELLLTVATPRKDCKDIAKALLGRFKTLQRVLEASPRELQEIEGVGPTNQFGIRLVKAVADRYLKKRLIETDPLNNSKELYAYLRHSIGDKVREYFKVVFLNAKNRVLAVETLFKGTLTASSVYPREVILAALNHDAAALIFAHNHPSGDPAPSPEDMRITRQLIVACAAVGITVHEHIVMGNNSYYSFADHGHIARIYREHQQREISAG
ncbi:MAG: DNA repair protein RadC [Thermodesulfobacteriota bacterium]